MKIRKLLLTMLMASSSAACAPGPQENANELSSRNAPAYPLLWESSKYASPEWSLHTMEVIQNEVAPDLLPGAEDVESFCPLYRELNNEQRANFWALLVSAIVKFESGFDPTERFRESSMGTDRVTGQQIYSEGLMQMSYGDTLSAPFCEFDWDSDKRLRADDPRKTIFDPETNLSCGIKILARQIRNRNRISIPVGKGAYWSVLERRANEIRSLTKKMTGCQR